jgi:hypothetical protein
MANGRLRLDLNYASDEHPTGTWVDQKEHRDVIFQYDPGDLKWQYQSGWAMGDDQSVADNFNFPWNYGDKDQLRELSMVLHFDDYSALFALTSARKAVDTLEAYLKPIMQPHIQPVRIEFERTVTLLKLKQRMIVEENSHRQITGDENSGATGVAWRALMKSRYQKKVTFTQKATGPALGTLLNVDRWHSPRPLLLRLQSNEEWQCLLKDMEIDYVRFDVKTGVPTVVDARVTLIERFGIPVNGAGMVLPKTDKVDGVKDIADFNKFVASGAIRLKALPPLWESTDQIEYKLSGSSNPGVQEEVVLGQDVD